MEVTTQSAETMPARKFTTKAYIIVDQSKDIVGVRLTSKSAEMLCASCPGSVIKKFDATK